MTQKDNLDGIFSHAIHITRGTKSSSKRVADPSRNPLLSVDTIISETDDLENLQNNLKIIEGRVNLQQAISELNIWGNEAVVFACGPASLSESCNDLALKYKISFHAETFEF